MKVALPNPTTARIRSHAIGFGIYYLPLYI
jgi:hypothetical protein